MERNTRSIIPNNMNNKPRSNGPISPREINSNYNHHQSQHWILKTQQQQQQNHQHPHTPYHPNLDLINFVSSAWKEKVSSDKTEYFKDYKSESSTDKFCNFDLDGFLLKMRNS
ncbi:hypothetical protein ACKWTF_005752 [Chironomus riparius]